jgi:hypothetical protein
MEALLAIFVAKLLDPFGGISAMILGAIGSTRLLIPIGALVGAIFSEILLNIVQSARGFDLAIFAIGFCAMMVWSAVGNLFLSKLVARRKL